MKFSTLALAATAAALPLSWQQLTLSPTNMIDQVVGLLKQSVSDETTASEETFHQSGIPSKEEAARVARTLVHRESLTTMVTVNKDNIPEGYVEYYADCGTDGNPVMLNVHIGTGFRNIAAGSAVTLSIRVGDHPVVEHTNPWYPGGIVKSAAGSPRVSLRGKFEDLGDDEIKAVESCFLKRHPDAKWWLPGNDVHTTHWVKFNVDSLHMVGGFGDRAYIGNIDGDVYRSAKLLGHGEGDMSEQEFVAHHGMNKEEFKKHHGMMGKKHGMKHRMKGKHHGNKGKHPKMELTKEQLVKIHAALSEDPEKFVKAHSGDFEASGKVHQVDANHGKDLTEEQLLKIHAALSDNPEAFKAHHVAE
ncbi:hypothetical protein CJU90_2150 [Yarrowia sp. C11]|nr:hypothetical protein CKK34_6178 [Yarrowia sp. E02]KAG5372073.1 hypothetical protein CJU90_2150 [Yarrowia sp. C11]